MGYHRTEDGRARHATGGKRGGSGSATVYDKAGWIADDEWGNAVNDCGFVEVDGRTYLVAALTSQPDGEGAEHNVSELARALVEACASLT